MSFLVEIKEMGFGSPEQIKSIELRERCLVHPLGASFTQEEYNNENDSIHIGAFDKDNNLVGCVIIVPYNNDILKLRQFVVETSCQRKGIGTKILNAVIEYGKNNGYTLLKANVIHTARDMYLKNNWKITGDEFQEVNHPHFPMEYCI